MLQALTVGDPPQAWAALGFIVDERATRVGHVDIHLGGPQPGIAAWQLSGLDPAVTDLDGLGVDHASERPRDAASEAPHPTGVIGLDHVVVATPDLPRTVDALAGAGLELRRVRDAGRDASGRLRQQAFFWLGSVILEVVGPAEPAGTGPPSLWGLAFTGFPYAIALKTGSPAAVNSSFLLFFPFAFLTTTFVPEEALTGWLATIATYNPVTYILEALRSLLFVGWDATALAQGLGVKASEASGIVASEDPWVVLRGRFTAEQRRAVGAQTWLYDRAGGGLLAHGGCGGSG